MITVVAIAPRTYNLGSFWEWERDGRYSVDVRGKPGGVDSGAVASSEQRSADYFSFCGG